MSSFSLFGTSLKNLFSKPATKMYPVKPFEPFEATRGHVSIDIEKCILCGLCYRSCPVGAITVVRDDKSWSIDALRCITCNDCVSRCPVKCLTMETQYMPVAVGQSVSTFVKSEPKAEPEPDSEVETEAE
ncbi:MAG: 4Fe-4S dicluster domain-containing protein [Coriobacteriales bacterium]|nr:4Fe-4S dicluster domain-containing protein [Coriobacteriales bacterium]